LILKSGKLTRA